MSSGTAYKILQHLQSYDLQGKGPEYNCNSPLRAGSNSHGFTVTITDDEHGAWFDHVTGEKGSLYELAEKLGIETPKREQVENSKRGYSSLADYADAKGVPEKVFIDAKWEPHTYFDGRPCFKYPTGGGMRYRFTDGNKPTFKSEQGYKPNWYGLKRAITLADKKPLILCNGEPSTVVAQYFNMPAFCLPSGETQGVSTELLTQLKNEWKGSVIIALDCDKAGNEGAYKFADAFKSVNINYTIVDLMLTTGGDLADFCRLHHETLKMDFDALPRVNPKVPKPEKNVDVRDLFKAARDLQIARTEGGELDQALDRLQTEIYRIRPPAGEVVSFERVSNDYEAWIKDNLMHPGEVQGFRTGMEKLDSLTGGLDKNCMYVLLAETGMGKSTVVSSIGSNLADQAPGIIIPTESSARDWWNNIVAYRCDTPKHLMRQGRLTPQQAAMIYSTNAILRDLRCEVIDCQNPTPSQILQVARNAIDSYGCQWIILDSLSNVKSEGSRGIFDTVSDASDCAQELARMGLAVLSTSQVGRSLEGRDNRIPTLHDGKGSGRIEENADVVMGLYNHDVLVKRGVKEPTSAFPEGTVTIRCLKHRFMGEKEGVLIQLTFKGGVGTYD